MARRIAIILGHPDAQANHFGRALADAYATGAAQVGHEVKTLTVATLDFSLLRRKEDWENGTPSESIRQAQGMIGWADHLLIVYPLWLGSMPAILKAFLEQVFRPGFAISKSDTGKSWRKLLSGKTARIVVTMGMPAFLYRWYFGAHSLKSLKRNILGFCGIGPISENLIGLVESPNGAKREKWLGKMRALGGAGR
ncbi:MAG: NAD(P)H-dependent oxidoreductase [Betaproteobacteria bacterium]|nr:NAD(P)H-dependent oxidoreductase [Betaproteobacteria bacterium]